MPTPSTTEAVQAALALKRIEDLERQLDELKEEHRDLKNDRDKFLRWGVITLGGAVVTLVTWIFNLLTKHN